MTSGVRGGGEEDITHPRSSWLGDLWLGDPRLGEPWLGDSGVEVDPGRLSTDVPLRRLRSSGTSEMNPESTFPRLVSSSPSWGVWLPCFVVPPNREGKRKRRWGREKVHSKLVCVCLIIIRFHQTMATSSKLFKVVFSKLALPQKLGTDAQIG